MRFVISISLFLLSACGSPEAAPTAAAGAVAPAPAPAAPTPPAAPDPGARLVGTWEMIQEFGGGDCDSLDCASDRAEGERTRAELRADGTFVETRAPIRGTAMPPMEGNWRASAEGEAITLSVDLRLGDSVMPGDPQTITFRDADTYERRNARNRHGGVWRRVAP